MIGYVTVGTNAWANRDGSAGIGLTKPFDGDSATVGNGVMVAFAAKSEEDVQRLYDCALAHGGTCEGPPGPRGDGFYAAYFRDPDGNKLNAFIMTT
jgi:predicted lactoylglutathione lyase